MKKIFSLLLVFTFIVTMPLSVSAAEYTDNDTVEVREIIEANYSNEFVVVPTWKLSDTGKAVKVRYKPDLGELDAETLHFYSYNKNEKKLALIKDLDYSLDSKGILSFSIGSNQGFVIITDSKLVKLAAAAVPVKKEEPSKVFWVANGKCYHQTDECATLKRSRNIKSGSISTARSAGRTPCKVCH